MATNIPKSIRATLYIDGKPAEGTMKNLESVTTKLNRELKQLEVGTEAWNRKMKEVQMHRNALKGLNDEIKGTTGLFGFLKTEIGKFGALAAGYLGFQFVTDQFRNVIMANADLSDSIADVRKTTGLSEVAVRRLNAEFKKIDTRSSRDELNGLARVAGKLGISAEEDVLGFVRAADKISVALGEDLGGSEEAINKLGKLVEIFKLKDDLGLEQALLNVGSAINELGAAGTANEGYIVEFTKRLAGIAPAANMSIQDVMALGAVMDELGQPVESSATALGQFIVGLGQDIPKFAKIAGMSVKEFSGLLQTDGNRALVAVLKNVNSTGAGVAGLAANMGMLGEDGARAIQALGSLSGNLKLLETRQNLANAEFSKGLSLTEEFNVKNNTFGATIDKLRKKLGELTSNFAFQDFLMKVTLLFSNGIDFINRNTDAIGRWIKVVVVAGSAIVTYRTYLMMANTALFQFIATVITGEKAMVLSRTATIALTGVKALLTGNLTKAAQAWRLLNITMAANPAGAVIAGIVAIGVALTMFNSKLGIAAQAQKNMNDINQQAESATNAEKLAIDRLLKSLAAENTTKEQKLASVNELRRIMPEVLKGYSDEEILAGRATAAIRDQVAAIVSRAKARAIENKITALEEQKGNVQGEINAGPDKWERLLMGFNKTVTLGQWDPLAGWFSKRSGEIQEINALQADLEENLAKVVAEKPKTKPVDPTVPPVLVPGLTKEELSKQKKLAEEFEKLKKDIESWQGKADKNDPDSDRELVEIEIRYAELIKRAVGHQDQMDEIELTRKTLRDQRWQEIDKENAKKSRENALQNLNNAYDQEELLRTQRLQERLEQIDASDKSEIEKGSAKAAVLAEFEQQSYQAKQENLIMRALLLEAQIAVGNLELDEEKRIAAEKISLQKQVADNAIAEQNRIAEKTGQINQARVDSEKNLQLAIYDAMGTGISLIGGLFKQSSAMAKGFFALEKIAAAAKVIFMHIQEVAAIRLATAAQVAWASSNPFTMGLIPVIKATGAAQVLTSKINLGAGLATIASQAIAGFETGGFSDEDPAGFVNRETVFRRSASGRPFRAGEKGRREWIAPSWMLENPRTANIIGMLESSRKNRGLASGTDSVAASGPGSNMDMSELTRMFGAFIEAQTKINNRIPVLIKKDLDDIAADQQRISIDLDA